MPVPAGWKPRGDLEAETSKAKKEKGGRDEEIEVDKAARQETAKEYEYQSSGYVDPTQAKGPGKQKAAEYFMGGVITSTIQQVGNKKVVYYKATFELTDIETTEIVWTDHKEITKHFKKKSIGF